VSWRRWRGEVRVFDAAPSGQPLADGAKTLQLLGCFRPTTQDRAFSGFMVRAGSAAFPAKPAPLAWYQARLGSRVMEA
jgi:hypothetical protein